MNKKMVVILISLTAIITIITGIAFGEESGFLLDKSATECSSYSTLKGAVEEVPTNKYSSKITLNQDSTSTDTIKIAGNQSVTIDLNGHVISATEIFNYGNLIITDSKNTETTKTDAADYITIGGGEVKSQIYNSGSLTIKAGKFDKPTVKYDETDSTGTDLSQFVFVSPNPMLEQSSVIYASAKSGDDSYYVFKSGNLDYSLCYEICDSNGDIVKSTDSDDIQDISIGEKYTVKIYIKSNNMNPVKLNCFDVTMTYKIKDSLSTDTSISDKIIIDTPYDETNKYFSVKKSVFGNTGILTYSLENGSYYIPAGIDSSGLPVSDDKGLKIAQYNLTVKNGKLDTGEKIQLGFARFGEFADITATDIIQKVAVMDGADDSILGNVFINSVEEKVINTRNVFDGVSVASYKYSPEGYMLAIITKEHGKDEFLTYGEDNIPMYYTSNPNYVALSTNVLGVKAEYSGLNEDEIKKKESELNLASPSDTTKLGRVYLKLINPNELVKDGLLDNGDLYDYDKINKAVEREITVNKISEIKGNFDTEEEFLNAYNLEYKRDKSDSMKLISPYDVDCDGTVDYNDASMVYQMLVRGGDYWKYDSGDLTNYLGEKGRLLSASGKSGKLYGSIEDVAEIIKHYSK